MKRFLIAAGGTGGHLFPALAVVEKLKEKYGSSVSFHFFGRKDKIEGRVVPSLGYTLHTTKLTGLVKRASFATLLLPFRIFCSVLKLICNIKKEHIDAVICTGAYLSYPAGIAASLCGKKLFLLESNVNPGKAIKMLTSRATLIFTSFKETANYYNDAELNKLCYKGNPIRQQFFSEISKEEALKSFGLRADKPVVLIFGGSLGAKAINDAVLANLDRIKDYQLLWQTGSTITEDYSNTHVRQVQFIDNMAAAYRVADVVVCRSGATTLAELAVIGKSAILVPLSSAANNEQYHNAQVAVEHNAAILLKNDELQEGLFYTINSLLKDEKRRATMDANMAKLGNPNASEEIAVMIYDNTKQKSCY